MHVAEKASLPTAEAVPCHGNRYWHVDSDHTHLHAPGDVAVAREARPLVAELVRIDKVQGTAEVRSLNSDAEEGSRSLGLRIATGVLESRQPDQPVGQSLWQLGPLEIGQIGQRDGQCLRHRAGQLHCRCVLALPGISSMVEALKIMSTKGNGARPARG